MLKDTPAQSIGSAGEVDLVQIMLDHPVEWDDFTLDCSPECKYALLKQYGKVLTLL